MSLVWRTYRSGCSLTCCSGWKVVADVPPPEHLDGRFELWVRRTFRPRSRWTARYAGELTAARLGCTYWRALRYVRTCSLATFEQATAALEVAICRLPLILPRTFRPQARGLSLQDGELTTARHYTHPPTPLLHSYLLTDNVVAGCRRRRMLPCSEILSRTFRPPGMCLGENPASNSIVWQR